MSAYIKSPFKASPKLIIAGIPSYLWGSYNRSTGPTQGFVLSDSGNGATSTIVVQIQSGNIPFVGSLLTIVGTANAAGAYNFTNAIILSVSAPANPDSGVYTLTVSGSGNSASAADYGQFIIPQPEIGEALVAGASAPVCMPFNSMGPNLNQAMTVVASFPSLPTSVIVYLQQAVIDLDSEYQTIATIATVAGGAVSGSPQITVDPTLGSFFRVLNGTVVGGTLPTVVVKILL